MATKKTQTPKAEGKVQAHQQATNFYTLRIEGKEFYILILLLSVACFIVFRDFISAKKVYLFKDIGSDSVNIYYPWMTHMTDYIKTNGVPTWTFSQGMGQNLFPLWLGDFFSNFLTIFCGRDSLPYGLALMEIVKILLCGIVFFKYLQELKLSGFVSAIGAFLFAFCGYIILGGCWTIFSVEALYAALILYGFERWLNRGKWFWFVVGLTCMSFLQPFFLFMYTLFLAAYVPVRYNDVREGQWKAFPVFILKTLGLSVLGVAMSAYQLLPDILQYMESPRVGGEAGLSDRLKAQSISLANDTLQVATTFRSFGSDMLGTGSNYRGWQNYLEAPLFYCGIFCLVIFPQAFVGLTKRQRVGYGILAGLAIVPVLFPYFRYVFWAFSGDYFRTFSLIVTLLLLFFSVKALHGIIRKGEVNKVVLGVTVVVLLVLLYTPDTQFKPTINQGLRTFATLLIFVYSALLIGLGSKGDFRQISKVFLMLACFIELTYFSNITVNKRDVITSRELKDRVGYNDYTTDAIRFIKSQDKGFYRIQKDYSSGPAIHASINDAKVQGYFGTPSYFSFNQKNYIKFLGDLNVINPKDEFATRWAKGLVERPILFSLASGKYWLSKRSDSYLNGFGYDSIAKFGDVKVYRNKFTLPFGVAHAQIISDEVFKKLSVLQKDLFLLRGCVVEGTEIQKFQALKSFNLADTAISFSMQQYQTYVEECRKNSLTLTLFTEKHIQGHIAALQPELLFFSMPFDEGWKATVNGKEEPLYRINAGLTGVVLQKGENAVDLEFEPRFMKRGAMVSVVAFIVFIGLLIGTRFFRKRSQVVRSEDSV